MVVELHGIFLPRCAGRVVPEADDRELWLLRERFEVIGVGDPPSEELGELDVRLDEAGEAG
jgi:hypothetical protein